MKYMPATSDMLEIIYFVLHTTIKTIGHGSDKLETDVKFVYEIMEKQ